MESNTQRSSRGFYHLIVHTDVGVGLIPD